MCNCHPENQTVTKSKSRINRLIEDVFGPLPDDQFVTAETSTINTFPERDADEEDDDWDCEIGHMLDDIDSILSLIGDIGEFHFVDGDVSPAGEAALDALTSAQRNLAELVRMLSTDILVTYATIGD